MCANLQLDNVYDVRNKVSEISDLNQHNRNVKFQYYDKTKTNSGRKISVSKYYQKPVPVAARSKVLVCGRSPAEIVGSNPTGSMEVCLLWMLCVVR